MQVKLGLLKTNKTYTLYAHPEGSPVVSLAAAPDGRTLASGHADGSVYAFTFPDAQDGGGGGAGGGAAKLAHHGCAPSALAWGESVVAAGVDSKVVFYDPVSGREQAAFDYGADDDDDARAFASAAANPAGDAVVVGGHDALRVFVRGGAKGVWQAAGVKRVRARAASGLRRAVAPPAACSGCPGV